MHVLIYWDNPEELALIRQFFEAAEHTVGSTTVLDELQNLSQDGGWQVVLLAIGHPDFEESFECFCHLRVALPDVPIVGASRPDEVFRSARFLTDGMRRHLVRDEPGDFVFLLSATLEAARESAAGERATWLANRLTMELEGHRDFQTDLLPANLPTLREYLINAQHDAATMPVNGDQQLLPGGDFYHVLQTDDDAVMFILGDTGGHALKTTLSTMSLHSSVARIAKGQQESPATIVSRINLWLCQHTQLYDDGGFITLFCGVLQLSTGQLDWCTAGHPIPLLHNLSTDEIEPLAIMDESAMPVGMVEESEYETHSALIDRGSRLVIYSDGLEEIYPDGTGEAFGPDGIMSELRKARAESGRRSLQRLFATTRALGGNDYRDADATALCIDRLISESRTPPS